MYKVFIQQIAICSMFILSISCNANPAVDNLYQDGVTVSIKHKKFNPAEHKILYCETNKPCAIDGKLFYGGSNGNMPKMEVESLTFTKGKSKIHLDVSSIYDTGITNKNIKKYIKVTNWLSGSYRITAYLGGGEEPDIAHWLVFKDSSVRNHLSGYESLADLLDEVHRDFNIKP